MQSYSKYSLKNVYLGDVNVVFGYSSRGIGVNLDMVYKIKSVYNFTDIIL